jgi:hypothetical protein
VVSGGIDRSANQNVTEKIMENQNHNPNQKNSVGDEDLFNLVFERVKPDMATLKTDELLQVSLDISAAVSTVLGVLPEAKGLRDQIVKELPTFDVARFDKLEDYAMALGFAHAKYLSATQPPDDLNALSDESLKVRERLLAEVKALVQHGVVGEAQIGQLKGANGYKNVATDLVVLTNVIQSVWPQIQGKILTTSQDLETALRTAARLFRVVGLREQGPAQVAQATDDRLRAYTLLLLAYDDARRAVAYLRSEQGDADNIVPSLHPGRPKSKKVTDPQGPETAPNALTTGGTSTAPAGAPHAPVAGGPAGASNGAAHPAAPATGSAGGPFV